MFKQSIELSHRRSPFASRVSVTLLLSLVSLCASVSLSPESATGAPHQPNGPPNILLVVSDDQPLGAMEAMTETRRWLRRNGTKYPNAYATTPVCCPSRASILTGRYAHNHGVLQNGQADALDTTTVVERVLSEGGYTTAAFGKFLNSWDVAVPPPSFDQWAVVARSALAYWGGTWNVEGEVKTIRRYGTTYVGDKAQKFIEEAEERDNQPWFAYLAPPAPHAPFNAEERYRDRNFADWEGDPSNFEDNPLVDPGGRTDKPPYVQEFHRSHGDGRNMREKQFRTLFSIDDMMEQLRGVLDATDEASNTVVIYLSDNGFLWAQHGIIGKFTPYVESVRIPALIRWPKDIDVPAVDDRLVANIDIAPTMLDAAGLSAGPDFVPDGRSLLDQSWERERLLIEAWAERRSVPTWAGFISASESYVEYYDTDDTTITFREYYDLVDDPYQLTNLLGDIDPLNDPPDAGQMSFELSEARRCEGPYQCP